MGLELAIYGSIDSVIGYQLYICHIGGSFQNHRQKLLAQMSYFDFTSRHNYRNDIGFVCRTDDRGHVGIGFPGASRSLAIGFDLLHLKACASKLTEGEPVILIQMATYSTTI
jgi:hypothetical protein